MKALSKAAIVASFVAVLSSEACAREHERGDRARQSDGASDQDMDAASPGPLPGASGRDGSASTPTHVVADTTAMPPSAADADRPDSAHPADASSAPGELGMEVWIGTLHNALITGVSSPIGVAAMAQRDVAAVVVMHSGADGKLRSGTVAFGRASEAPTLNAVPRNGDAGLNSFWYTAQYGLLEGFDYRMLSVTRSATQLRFLVSATQLWQAWCCHEDGSYECPDQVPAYYQGGGLAPKKTLSCSDLLPTQSFDLRIDGDLMEGTLAPAGDYFAQPVLRVRRQR
jgi:hypothetical protein